MEWYNEPDSWTIENEKLLIDVTPQSDYWRKTLYGFVVDDGPFYYCNRGGEFEVTVKISGEFKSRYDHMGLMLRIDEEHWIKTGIEYVDEVYNFSTVVTSEFSSWNVIALNEIPGFVWIKAIRRKNSVEILYSLDGENFKLSNLAYFPAQRTAMVGMMAASPDGEGYKAVFENFKIKHLPDAQRVEWLKDNQ